MFVLTLPFQYLLTLSIAPVSRNILYSFGFHNAKYFWFSFYLSLHSFCLFYRCIIFYLALKVLTYPRIISVSFHIRQSLVCTTYVPVTLTFTAPGLKLQTHISSWLLDARIFQIYQTQYVKSHIYDHFLFHSHKPCVLQCLYVDSFPYLFIHFIHSLIQQVCIDCLVDAVHCFGHLGV